MNLKSALYGILAVVSALSCSETGEQPEPEVKTALSFEMKDVEIYAGKDSQVSLEVTPVESVGSVEFSVADESVVSISETKSTEKGIVLTLHPESLGTTTLAAALGDQIAVCGIRVSPVEVSGIVLDTESIELPVSGTHTLKVTLTPDDATNPKVTWTSADDNVAVVSNGVITGIGEGVTVVTASVSTVSAECKVKVYNIAVTSLDLDVTSKEMSVGETFIVTATLLPEDATTKEFKWSADVDGVVSYELIDAVEGDNVMAARVAGVKPGTTILSVTSGGLKAECSIVVRSTDIPEGDPKVGDYYYSDGTWSDGGLLSINPDGTSPVWRTEKPAPVAGKTVIGIVFQTDASRISDAEKTAGHTHGLVMAIRSAHKPGETQTKYSLDYDFSIPNKRLGTSWYADIDGLTYTEKIKTDYAGKIDQCPAFDWTVTDFSPSAPVGTSGWYVPSIGQVWDMLANLGGGEMAAHLKKLRDYSSDISYYWRDGGDLNLSYNPVGQLNSTMALVPESDKEEFIFTNSRSGERICELMSSSLYDNEEGSVCIFWLYEKGALEPESDHTDQTYLCRPVLSF